MMRPFPFPFPWFATGVFLSLDCLNPNTKARVRFRIFFSNVLPNLINLSFVVIDIFLAVVIVYYCCGYIIIIIIVVAAVINNRNACTKSDIRYL